MECLCLQDDGDDDDGGGGDDKTSHLYLTLWFKMHFFSYYHILS